MKLVYLLLLSAPLLFAQQAELPKLVEKATSNKNQKELTKQWITFHQNVLRAKDAFLEVKKEPLEENIVTFLAEEQRVQNSLNQLVAHKELVVGSLEFSQKKLSKEQANLLQYCFISVEQIYGKSASQEMFGLGFKMRYELKKEPDIFRLKTRLPMRFHVMLKRVIENRDLKHIELPRPVDVRTMTKEKDLWVCFYRSLDLTLDLITAIDNKKDIGIFKATDAFGSIHTVFNKFVELNLLQTKTYPFSIEQLTKKDQETYRKFVSSIEGFAPTTAQELLGIGAHSKLKAFVKEKTKKGKLTYPQDTLSNKLTIYLPKASFDKVSQFLDKLEIPKPTTK